MLALFVVSDVRTECSVAGITLFPVASGVELEGASLPCASYIDFLTRGAFLESVAGVHRSIGMAFN